MHHLACRYLLTPLFFGWFVGLTLLFEATLPVDLAWGMLVRRMRLAEAIRWHVWHYGRFLLAISWPVLRIRRRGIEHLPAQGPVVYILNHRSATDAFFATAYAGPQTIFLVRSWPFRIPLYGPFMRRSGYVDIESQSFTDFLGDTARRSVEQGLSFIIFPEGHRSRDGKLHRFHRGAFELAARYNLPVVPVCLQGTERFCPVDKPRIQPAKVTVTVLPPVLPSHVRGDDPAGWLREQTLKAMREHLNEHAA